MSALVRSDVEQRHRGAKARKCGGSIRVMLVDDSIVARAILERIIESDSNFTIVASMPSAADAIDALAHATPDIIILDIDMPGMSGLTALPIILDKAQGARVLILSANCAAGGPAAVEALAHGAADTMLKPGRGAFAGTFGKTLVERLHALSDEEAAIARVPQASVSNAQQQSNILPHHACGISAIGIGASTGGIMAINAFLGALPPELDCPIFITQHLPSGFMPFFAEQLHRLVARPVCVVNDGMPVAHGTIYLASGEGHIALAHNAGRTRIMIDRSVSASGATPSVDPMLVTMAAVYGRRACGVMLSGMGRDGLDGARSLRAAGGLILAQDMESCVVWGMPGAVVREGLADSVQNPISLAKIAIAAYRNSATEAA